MRQFEIATGYGHGSDRQCGHAWADVGVMRGDKAVEMGECEICESRYPEREMQDCDTCGLSYGPCCDSQTHATCTVCHERDAEGDDR